MKFMDLGLLPLHVTGLVVQSKEGHGGVNGFPALSTQPHHLQPCLVDLLCQLIDGDVTGSTHQHWTGRTNIRVLLYIPKM